MPDIVRICADAGSKASKPVAKLPLMGGRFSGHRRVAIHGFFHTADAFIRTGYRCVCNPSESVWGRGYFLLISFPQVAIADLNDAGEIHG